MFDPARAVPQRMDHILAGLSDRALTVKYQARALAFMGKTMFRRGPLTMKKRMERFAWFEALSRNGPTLQRLLTQGRTGAYREAVLDMADFLGPSIEESIHDICTRPGRVVLHEDVVFPEILQAMGLVPWNAEWIGILLPSASPEMAQSMIDTAENAGIPPDVCSLPKVTMGLVLEDQMPRPAAMVTCNMPCDGGMSSYTVMKNKYQVPAFYLDVPYHFNNERAVAYFVRELKLMIAWLEQNTPGRMDWGLLREICEMRNRAVEHELELWDLIAQKPALLAAEPVLFSHLASLFGFAGTPRFEEIFKKMLAYARKNQAAGRGALKNERYRAALWSPLMACYPEVTAWMEQAFGVAMIMDMMTYNEHPFVDTSSPGAMLESLARIMVKAPMAQHTRGPSDNFFTDLFRVRERFSIDMVIMAGHVGCKNTMALNQMFREKCREREIPLLIIPYDLIDSRVASPEVIRKHISSFMETIMGAERLDGV